MVICLYTRFKSILLWPRIISKCILWVRGHNTIDLNLLERQITIQIVPFTWIRRTVYKDNILVCQVSSEPLGRTNLKTESGVST